MQKNLTKLNQAMVNNFFGTANINGNIETTTPPQTKRLIYNDLAKALGMLLIIWGHIRLGDTTNAFVYAFHIPLFFFLSGMVFSRNRYPGFRAFAKKKFISLLIPYFIFSILTWLVWVGFARITHADVESYWMPLAQTFIAQGSGGFLVHNVPLWFVTCLFVMEICYFFISKLNAIWIFVVSIALAAVSYCLITYQNFIDITLMPWNIEVACLGLIFFAAGNFIVQRFGNDRMQKWVNSHKPISICLIIIGVILVYFGSQYNGNISFGHSDLGRNVFVAYSCAFVGVGFMLVLCMLLADVIEHNRNSMLAKFMIWFGQNSFYAMVIHNPIKGIACVAVSLIVGYSTDAVSHSDWYSLIAFAICLFVTIIGIKFIKFIKEKPKRPILLSPKN